MIKVTLKRDVVKSYAAGTTPAQVAADLGPGLLKAACAARIDGAAADLREPLQTDCRLEILTFDDPDGRLAFRHTASHILAQAVKRLYPQAKLAIGPAIENGFYYDIDSNVSFTPEHLEKIEAEMKRIVKENLPIERYCLPREQALAFFAQTDESYKIELIEDLPPDAPISFYRQGEFTDLCAGSHLLSTGAVKAFKLTSCTGAYWRGDSSRKMLQRIYGTAFPKASALEAYLEQVEQAKLRDHNKIGRELEYFTTVDIIGQGLPVLLPKGARTIQILQRYVEDTEQKRGYLLTKTPFMAKRELYQLSGHWEHYKDSMFIMGDPDDQTKDVYALRPMTCPFQYQVFLNRTRSYRDLPMRLAETSTLFRNEDSGEMHGLIRVRQFTISEAHLILRPEQLEAEFKGCLSLAKEMLEVLGLAEDVSYRFSQWDPNDQEKFIGTPAQWDEAQTIMEKILKHLNVEYTVGIGEAAFYGPKLDIQIKNVHGKEDTIITIQVDQMLAEKFSMEYIDADGSRRNPYIIHRTSIGCYERTLALLLEKYAGALPCWMAPMQAVVLPITDRVADYADKVARTLEQAGIRVKTDHRNEKIGYKIREAQLEKIPYMLVVGDKEAADGAVSIRARSVGDCGVHSLDACLAELKAVIEKKQKDETPLTLNK